MSAFRREDYKRVIAACTVCVSASLSAFAATAASTGSPTGTAQRTVFVAPFESGADSAAPDPNLMVLTDLVTFDLNQCSDAKLVDRQFLKLVQMEQNMARAGLTRALQLGRLLRADTVVYGIHGQTNGVVTMKLEAVECRTGRLLAREQAVVKTQELSQVAFEVARVVARILAIPMREVKPEDMDSSPAAGMHFARGLAAYHGGNLLDAISEFMLVMDLDPNYSEALFWSGQCYTQLEMYDHAILDLETYQKRDPQGSYMEDSRRLLNEALRRVKRHPSLMTGTNAVRTAERKAP